MGVPSAGRFAPCFAAVSIALLPFFQSALAEQIDVHYAGGSDYDNPATWSPQIVPNNGNGGNTYRVTIEASGMAHGPTSESDVSVDALTLEGTGALRVTNHLFRSAATTNNSTVLPSVYAQPSSATSK